MEITTDGVRTLPDNGLPWSLGGVWFKPNRRYFIVGDGIYYAHSSHPNLWGGGANELTPYYTTKIKANDVNDIFVVGAFGELLHYNGSSWKSFRTQTALENGSFTSIAVNKNSIIAVGGEGSRAVITIGKR